MSEPCRSHAHKNLLILHSYTSADIRQELMTACATGWLMLAGLRLKRYRFDALRPLFGLCVVLTNTGRVDGKTLHFLLIFVSCVSFVSCYY
jgi:hypothetical protein